MVGLGAALGCGSLGRPKPLSETVAPPAVDAGGSRSVGVPDASTALSRDAQAERPIGPAADAATRDAATDGAAREAGASLDAGGAGDGGADATVISPLASTVVTQDIGTVDALAADGATLYELTHDNALWVLEAGGAPRLLTRDGGTAFACSPVFRLALDTGEAFWIAQSEDATHDLSTVLHRTDKGGAGDTVIATGLAYAEPPIVAADDARVYWVEGEGSPDGTGPGAVIRALPADAAPDTAPTTLVSVDGSDAIGAMTVSGPTLYWVSFYLYTTVTVPDLHGAQIAALLAPDPPAPLDLGTAWYVQPHGGSLYVDYIADIWHFYLAREAPDGSDFVSLGLIPSADNIVFVDDWALVSVPSGSCGDHRHLLLALPTAAPGGTIVQLADDLGTPAVLGTELAYVDLAGQVHTSTLDQVRAALAAAGR
ncbi:MAG TPA: hypothetical protein VHO06_23865 [Polyangia bacterium]|nr:hypothetical protein [Polyangia bacterium]